MSLPAGCPGRDGCDAYTAERGCICPRPTLTFRRVDGSYAVADAGHGDVYGIILQAFGGYIVMRNEKAVGTSATLDEAIDEAERHHAALIAELR